MLIGKTRNMEYLIIGILIFFVIILLCIIGIRKQHIACNYLAKMDKGDLSENIQILAMSMRQTTPVGSIPNSKKIIRKIKAAYKCLCKKVDNSQPLYEYEKWLYENFNKIFMSFARKDYTAFCSLAHKKNNIRILELARLIVANTKCVVDRDNIKDCIGQFCSITPLKYAEICNIQLALEFAIMEKIAEIAKWCKIDYKMKAYATRDREINMRFAKYESYMYYFKHCGKSLESSDFNKKSEINTDNLDINYEKILVNSCIIVSNCVASYLDMQNIFDYKYTLSLSNINNLLEKDENYRDMDVCSKSSYLFAISKLAKMFGATEEKICQVCNALSTKFDVDFGQILFEYRYAIKQALHKVDISILRKPTTKLDQRMFISAVFIVNLLIVTLSVLLVSPIYLKIIVAICMLFSANSLAFCIISKIISSLIPNRAINSMDYECVPDNAQTLVVISQYIANANQAKTAIEKILSLKAGNSGKNIKYLMLIDLKSAQAKTTTLDQQIFDVLHSCEDKEISFLVRHREEVNKKFVAKERKRGAIETMNKALMSNDFSAFSCVINCPSKPTFIILLDDDNTLEVGTVKKAINTMLHPLNEKYDLMTFSSRYTLDSMNNGYCTRWVNDSGKETYCNYSSFYNNLSGHSIYCGKGIYRLDRYHEKLKGQLPDGKVLSHDIIEGAIVACGDLGQIAYEEAPSSFESHVARNNRWSRGDLLLSRFINSPKVSQPIYRFVMLSNIVQTIAPITTLVLWLTFLVTLNWWLLVPIFVASFASVIIHLSFYLNANANKIRARYLLGHFFSSISLAIYDCVMLPFWAVNNLWIITKTLYKSIFDKKSLLEWKTYYELQKNNNAGRYFAIVAPSVIVMTVISAVLWSYFFLLVYTFVFVLVVCLNFLMQRPISKLPIVKNKDKEYLTNIANLTCNYFATCFENNDLICDNYQVYPFKGCNSMTSSTNIGMGLLYYVCAFQLGHKDLVECQNAISKQCDLIEKLNKWNGHLYNWYNLADCMQANSFVSSVDSGNFVACLIVVREFCHTKSLNSLVARLDKLIKNTQFDKLVDTSKNIFHIGYDTATGKYTGNYNMLASESRLLAYVAGALSGDMVCWNNLDTKHCRAKGNIIVSWSGTAFEYLMPQIFIKDIENSMLTNSMQRFAKLMQNIKCNSLWGISESGYYAFDQNNNYQYHAFGLSQVGIRAENNKCVISPYSTFLAMRYNLKACIKNANNIQEKGGLGELGFYEAIDFTQGKQVVFSHMSHHQGMILASLTNILCDDYINKLFMSNIYVKSAQLALETKANCYKSPKLLPKDFEYKSNDLQYYDCAKITPNMPSVWGLRNENYSVLLDSYGCGFSRSSGRYLNRYKPDLYQDCGSFVYLKENNTMYCPTFAPIRDNYIDYECAFTPYSVEYTNKLHDCSMQVYLVQNMNSEVRKLTINNTTDSGRSIEIAYFEQLSMLDWEEDNAHPAFLDLFVNISYEKQNNAIIAQRKFRSQAQSIYCALVVLNADEIKPICNTENFVGRNNTLAKPIVFENKDNNNANIGDTISPCLGCVGSVKVNANDSTSVYFVKVFSDNIDTLKQNIQQINSQDFCRYAYESTKAPLEAKWKKYLTEQKVVDYVSNICQKINYCNYSLEKCKIIFNNYNRPLPFDWDRKTKYIYTFYNGDDNKLKQLVYAVIYSNLLGINVWLYVAYEGAQYSQSTLNRVKEKAGIDDINKLNFIKFFAINDKTKSSVQLLEKIAFCDDFQLIQDCSVGHHNSIWSAMDISYNKVELPHLMQCSNGGFNSNGEYYITSTPKLCFSNVICGEKGGCVVTENGGGFVYNSNSYFNKLTNWGNNALIDQPSESFYMSFGGKLVRINKLLEGGYVKHALANTQYVGSINDLSINLQQSIIMQGEVKVAQLTITNKGNSYYNGDLLYKVEPCLSNAWNKSMFFDEKVNSNTICISNALSGNSMYLVCSENIKMLEDKCEFCDLKELQPTSLGVGKSKFYNPAHAFAVNISLKVKQSKTILFYMCDKLDIAKQMENVNYEAHLAQTVDNFYNPFTIKTTNANLDILFNNWLLYQVESSRINGKCGFYQVGGAIGFRDQLQDCLALLYKSPEYVRSHILNCAQHQFVEGDVQHWWHPVRFGVRTKISDDKLFLVYLTYEYIKVTGDSDILNEQVEYLQGAPLVGLQEAHLEHYKLSDDKESLLGHLKRAIDSSLVYGEHNLLLIGGGDWNDALNDIGMHGRGESVWLTMFAVDVISKFLTMISNENKSHYTKTLEKLKSALDKCYNNGYYSRAYTDSGEWLGVEGGKYMQIDLLCQSWATIAEIGDKSKQQNALMAASRLVDDKYRIIKLLDPPFDKNKYYGYISAYPKGVRENGGQYTHASVWYAKATAMNKQQAVANKLLNYLNPIERCCNKKLNSIYKGEPYVLPADIYTNQDNYGRMGWSWYTGSASWLYDTIIKEYLGISIEYKSLHFKQPIIDDWCKCHVEYKYKGSKYCISYKQDEREYMLINGIKHYGDMSIPLKENLGEVKIVLFYSHKS